jgi:hypothetical protein
MTAQGIIAAIAVSTLWIVLQNVLMHFRPAEDRFGAMLKGYAISLPFVFVGYHWLPPFSEAIADAMRVESYWMGLFHAYFFHLLLFFCYAECFYHIERSVTLRFFVELLQRGGKGAKMDVIRSGYPVDDMIRTRLEVMRDQRFLEQRGDHWHLCRKGLWLARVSRLGSRLFQFMPQHKRR